MYVDGSIRKYLKDLAAKMPAPGGGSSAALSGAMAAALMSMVLNFTIGNKKYKSFEDVASKLLIRSEELRAIFIEFFMKDIKSYEAVADAYKLPKDTEEHKKGRKEIMQNALKHALSVPLDICKYSVEAMRFCPELAKNANKNLICDVEVPVRLLEAAFYSAKINVVMNQKEIEDIKFNEIASRELNVLEEGLLTYKGISETEINKIIGK
ncbi:MAG: cyclodeaminase/cyclohydrolase family protein [Candidatus Omnitrophica bacterium]|nr:cyclodeaminase/cyclohydrolase family protein [Candidatus Omnitrophota bacterium]